MTVTAGRRHLESTDVDAVAPFVAWPAFLAERFDWQQGEHLSAIGPTGTGKTTLCLALAQRRSYVGVLATKGKDSTLERLRWRRVLELPREAGMRPTCRVVVWPPYRQLGDRIRQRAVLARALDDAFRRGGWCVLADELAYLARLGLAPLLEQLWQQGRSVGCTLVGATQRPRHVPLDAYSAATHLFLWRTNDSDDLKRIAGLNGVDTATVRAVVAALPRHEALYVNTRTGNVCRTLAPAPGGTTHARQAHR